MSLNGRDGPAHRAEYVARINRVIDFIQANLAEDLTMERLAQVACFSPYHFHRIFRALVGEPLRQHVQRLRVERAAYRLAQEPNTSITEIALDCGYGNSAAFSRAFREAFAATPTEWRNGSHSRLGMEDRKFGTALSKLGNAIEVEWLDAGLHGTPPNWRITMPNQNSNQPNLFATVEVKDLPAMDVLYVRHIGPYAGQSELFGKLFASLMKYAGPRGLLGPDTLPLSVYYDDPDVTDESKLRLDCCITVPPGTQATGEVGQNRLPGGRYAVARFELLPELYGAAWDAVMGGWLPESGYQADDRPSYELYRNDPKQHPEGKQIVDLCVPVKPL
ncbi:MAG: AraC family transcriptional regulator [Polyangiaceae bacterium]|nr:AraC family transcriptional regulator [Polyangiaceae bacterium]